MKKLISVIILSAMLLTGCNNDKEPEKTTAASETTTEITTTEKITTTSATAEETTTAASYDFNIYDDAPVLSGEPREIDWNMIFEDGCMVIGAEKYPAYVKVGDLSSDLELGIIGVGEANTVNPDYLNDYYNLNYLGHTVGAIITSRKADVEPKEAYISVWMLGGECEVPKEKVGMLGFSLAQGYDEVTGIYLPKEENEGTANYYGVAECDSELFSCSLFYTDFISMLSITPYDANPDLYNQYTAK